MFPRMHFFLYSSKLKFSDGEICSEVGSNKWSSRYYSVKVSAVRYRDRDAEVLVVSRLFSLYLLHFQLSFLIADHINQLQSKVYYLILGGVSTCQLPMDQAMNLLFLYVGVLYRDSGFTVLAQLAGKGSNRLTVCWLKPGHEDDLR